eukprot:3613318-Prymnesium_polylepis.1
MSSRSELSTYMLPVDIISSPLSSLSLTLKVTFAAKANVLNAQRHREQHLIVARFSRSHPCTLGARGAPSKSQATNDRPL